MLRELIRRIEKEAHVKALLKGLIDESGYTQKKEGVEELRIK